MEEKITDAKSGEAGKVCLELQDNAWTRHGQGASSALKPWLTRPQPPPEVIALNPKGPFPWKPVFLFPGHPVSGQPVLLKALETLSIRGNSCP